MVLPVSISAHNSNANKNSDTLQLEIIFSIRVGQSHNSYKSGSFLRICSMVYVAYTHVSAHLRRRTHRHDPASAQHVFLRTTVPDHPATAPPRCVCFLKTGGAIISHRPARALALK
ncbi:hypothetical protein EVAR_92609_1 [Eumeta japonica]|uniref:Uncharacterized protein n=1 Tax=Eumeta variegata TaxID=151549 RepID=A0A4C1SXF3_EUMVA|nr:hypothetical protein EVAR_92609_1 [Eumeta japonica]